jgi:hypothetical protein
MKSNAEAQAPEWHIPRHINTILCGDVIHASRDGGVDGDLQSDPHLTLLCR